MKKRDYEIYRDEIMAGEVVKPQELHWGRECFGEEENKLYTNSWRPYRSMLFVPTEDKFANDLLYQSPNYPVLNLTDPNTCLKFGDGAVVKDAFYLGPLLQFFGYDEVLGYKDILRIRKTFFTGRFAKDNCELFGYKETKPEDLTYYRNGKEITDPKELKKRIAEERKSQKNGHRMFSGVYSSPLSSDYFDRLDDLGDATLYEVLNDYKDKLNAFAPSLHEGPVKKLTRF